MGKGLRPDTPLAPVRPVMALPGLHPITGKPRDHDFFAEHWGAEAGYPLVTTLGGSHGQGLATPQSDVDVRGVALASPLPGLGLHSISERFQREASEVEFFELANCYDQIAAGDFTAADTLFGPVVLQERPEIAEIREAAEMLLARPLVGGLSGFALREWGRAEKARAEDGNWTKPAARAIRTLWVATHLARTRRYAVMLPDTQLRFLRDIRAGQVPYAAAEVMRANAEEELASVAPTSTLREDADRRAAEGLVLRMRTAALAHHLRLDPERVRAFVDAEQQPPAEECMGAQLHQVPLRDLLRWRKAAPDRARVEIGDLLHRLVSGKPAAIVDLLRGPRGPLAQELHGLRGAYLNSGMAKAFLGESIGQERLLTGQSTPKDGAPVDRSEVARTMVFRLEMAARILRGEEIDGAAPVDVAPGDALARLPALRAAVEDAARTSRLNARSDMERCHRWLTDWRLRGLRAAAAASA
jgi:hypothetical protein